jgi:hypothetical protein
MFGLFKGSKSKEDCSALEKQYQQLLAESHRLSHFDRKKSDLKAAEADELRRKIDALEISKTQNNNPAR